MEEGLYKPIEGLTYDIQWIHNFLKEKHKTMETEVKPKLSKHISAAVNAIEKQVEKYRKQQGKALDRRDAATKEADELEKSIVGLREQIAKLQGE